MISEFRYKVLETIVKNPGITKTEICKKIKSLSDRAYVVIREFEKLGLVYEEKKDNLRKSVFVTNKGLEIFKNLKVIYLACR